MSSIEADCPVSPIEAEVRRTQSLLQAGDYDRAAEAAQALLQHVPENRDVLYMLAVSQRYLRLTEDALTTLERLQHHHPTYSRLHQERGHCLLALRNPAGAVDAFLQAVNLNAALPASWHALHVLFRSARRTEEAEMAAAHVAKLKGLPVEIVTASSMFADGEVHEAERVVRAFLRTHGDHIEAMRLLARIGIKLDVLDDAEFLLESVLAFAPDYHLARYDYVRVLLHRHRHAKALEESKVLLCAEPLNRDYRAVYAASCLALADYDEAIGVYRELAAEAPAAADIHLSIGHALKTRGQQTEAIAAYRKASDIAPSFGDAYWSLANLKTYRFTDGEVAGMRMAEGDSATQTTDRIHLCFALGKALEDRAEYAESFEHYRRGNALKRAEIRYSPDATERNAHLQTRVCTRDLLLSRRGQGCDRADPIFIVGLPRAGSTLIEQILASHSQVEGTMELADVARLAGRLQDRRRGEAAPTYPAILRELPPDQLRRLGETYIEDTAVYRTGKPFFVDKNPNNFRHLGLIRLILPRARIIDARREAMACCFGNFKQLFASGQEFTYDLGDIARYYRSYVALMTHWDDVMPGAVLRVQHEDLVVNLEANVRRMLDFCGLPFEPACVDFHRTERSVRTASSEQVRRPITAEGLTQWRNFEPWLDPLKRALA